METPLTLYPSGRRAMLMAGASTILALCCLALGISGKEIGYVACFFFVACGVLGTAEIWPRSSWLRIDETGIRYCYLFTSHHVAWEEIARFESELVSHSGLWGQQMTGFYRQPGPENEEKRNRLDELLPNNYGRSAKALTELLNQYRVHFARNQSTPTAEA
ncbi:PH domain-containing protein [Blastopirellula sp. J2-11]|uniref:PH domain-containing protein n=1 Tax=Blastopirellula sp. J2-11 TaxID=2943192 RepID=UPI0021CA7B22|nr:PH domain-containing protein [Blastopirellula sp. J2-11]UUO08269.1 PH domain-containing protein [Blastopirellula sp. J2-11]